MMRAGWGRAPRCACRPQLEVSSTSHCTLRIAVASAGRQSRIGMRVLSSRGPPRSRRAPNCFIAQKRRRTFVLKSSSGQRGGLDVHDEGPRWNVRIGGLQFRVSKTEVQKYLWPALGLAAIGAAGALIVGTWLLELLTYTFVP